MTNVRIPPPRTRSRGLARGRWLIALAPVLLVLALAAPTEGQQTQVVGTVTSADTGEPLGGVAVMVKGTSIGTLTNNSGRYSLRVPSPADTLVFSTIGFSSLEVPVDGRSSVDVTLAVSAVVLDEIVVTGYGTQQRRDLTGSISSIDGDEVTEVANSSVAQALQGKVAGVQVTPASGEPGQDAIIRIRGVGTLNDASPLFVVDGMLLDDIQFLSPEDVASVEVLKDASATAIYGSRGANGVIIITTRRGSASTRGTNYRFHAYVGTQSVINEIGLVNASQFAQLANELATNQGLAPYFPNGYTGPSTDWQDAIFESGAIQNYQFTASGGTDRVTYYFSANYFDQAGVIDHSGYDRVTVRVNNDYELSDNIIVGHNLNFSHTEDLRAPSVLGAVYRAEPTLSPTDADGDFNAMQLSSGGNPAAAIFYTRNQGPSQRLVGNIYGQAVIREDFTFRSSFGLDYERGEFRNFVPEFFVSPAQQNQESDIRVEFMNTDSWLWENTLTWRYLRDQHRLTLLGGITAQTFSFENLGGSRTNVAGSAPSLWYLNAGEQTGQTNFNDAYEWKMLSYLARANYTLMDRYLFTGSLRVDGSSRFSEDNRYGWFPSLAAGWDISQEAFMSGVDWVSALKLRGSWGVIGNDKIGAYPGVALITGNLNYVLGAPQNLVFGAAPIALANPDIQWEETSQYNLGLDAAFLRGRVETTLEYYNRTTDGILVQVPIPNYVGVNAQPTVNAAEVQNSGVEGTVTWFGRLGGVGLELSANGATINNEVNALGQGREEIFGGGLVNEIPYTTRTVVGEPIGSYWGYQIAGVFQNAQELATLPRRGPEQLGDLRYVDRNGDGVITVQDMTFIGSPIPDFVYGIDANLQFGSFDLSLGFSGQRGNEVFNAKKAVRFGVENFEESFLDRWTGEGTSDWEPRVTNAGHNYLSSERFIEDGSFFKMHSARLGYRLPQDLSSRMGVDMARLYVSGTNLFLSSDYSGYTPELTGTSVIASGIDAGVYPPSRVITVGLDLSF